MPRSADRGPVPPRSAPDPDAVADRRRRAVEEPLDVRLHALEPFADLEVRNPIHRTSYRVLLPEYPERDGALCTCTDFARRGLGTCKHVEAAWEWLRSPASQLGPTSPGLRRPPSGDRWPEVDRQLGNLSGGAVSSIRDVEAAGSVLFAASATEEKRTREGEKVGRSKPAGGVVRPTSRGRP